VCHSTPPSKTQNTCLVPPPNILYFVFPNTTYLRFRSLISLSKNLLPFPPSCSGGLSALLPSVCLCFFFPFPLLPFPIDSCSFLRNLEDRGSLDTTITLLLVLQADRQHPLPGLRFRWVCPLFLGRSFLFFRRPTSQIPAISEFSPPSG